MKVAFGFCKDGIQVNIPHKEVQKAIDFIKANTLSEITLNALKQAQANASK